MKRLVINCIITGMKDEKLTCNGKHYENPEEPCKPGYSCYVNSPEHYNCFFVYMYFNEGKQHTLQEIAHLLDMSHTTVKCIQDSALAKLKQKVLEGHSTINELSLSNKSSKD